MSSPGQPLDDTAKHDFLAARSGTPNYDWILNAASPGAASSAGGTATGSQQQAQSAAAPAAAPPAEPAQPKASSPFGLSIEQHLANVWNQIKGDTGAAVSNLESAAGGKPGVGDLLFPGLAKGIEAIAGAAAVPAAPVHGAIKGALKDQGWSEGAAELAADVLMTGKAPEGGLAALTAKLKTGTASPVPPEGTGSAKAAPAAETPAGSASAAAAKPASQGTRIFDIAGEEPSASVKVTPELRDKAAAYISGRAASSPIELHLDQAAADPVAAVSELAKVIPKDGVKAIDVTRMNAYSLNLSPEEVLSTLRPKFPSDELFDASAMAVKSAGEQFWKAARKATGPDATPQDMEEAVRAYALANRFVGALRDAKMDWGRAGRIQQEAAASFSAFDKQIHDMLQATGPETGPSDIEQVIRRAAQLDDPAKAPSFISQLRSMSVRDALVYGWRNLLLSNPATVIKKLTSDTTVGAWNLATRYAAEKLGSGAIAPGETAALMTGYVGSFGDAVRAAGKALRAGQSQLGGVFSLENNARLGELANGMERVPDEAATSPTFQAQQLIRAAMPTSWMGAADDFAGTMNYRAEARALIYRDGVQKGLSGPDLVNHVEQGMNNIPANVHAQALAAAEQNTFREPLTGVAAKLADIVDDVNIPIGSKGVSFPLGRVVLPFTKAPANFIKWVYRNSPAPLAVPSAAWRAEIEAGGASRDLAYARIGLGTAVSLLGVGLAASYGMTGGGPSDPEMRRAWLAAGNRPYSMHIGGKWYEYNRVEPLGTTLGAIADTADVLRFAHEDDANNAVFSLAFGVGNAMLSKTYMQGLADMLEALHDPNQNAARYAENLIASFAVPAGASGLDRAIDPWLRTHNDLLSTIAARTPGLSQSLPPQRDLWGDAIPRPDGFAPVDLHTGLSRMLSPIAVSPDTAQPIDKWIWDNRSAFPNGEQGRLGLNRPGQIASYEASRGISAHVKLTPQQWDRLKVLAGNELKDPVSGLGAKDALNALVQGRHPDDAAQAQWDNASPERRALMVLSLWSKYREGAKDQIAREFPDIQDAARAGFETRRAQLKPPTLGAGP